MTDFCMTKEQLKELQSRPFEEKVNISLTRCIDAIKECNGNCYVAFSGGKDSAVLLSIVSKAWKLCDLITNNKPLNVVFSDTRNEYLSIIKFVPEYCEYIERTSGITICLHKTKPMLNDKPTTYIDVCRQIGYPIASKRISHSVIRLRAQFKKLGYNRRETKEIINSLDNMTKIEQVNYLRQLGFNNTSVLNLTGITSSGQEASVWKISNRWKPLIYAPFKCSDQCCDILKKEPAKNLAKELGLTLSFTGEMATDSKQREREYLVTGCNAFSEGKGKSKPLGFWTEQDILRYHKQYKLPHAECYGKLLESKSTGILKFSKAQRTGCKLCLFGIQMGDGKNRLIELYESEPKVVEMALKPIKQGGLGYKDVRDYIVKNCQIELNLPKEVETNGNT